MVGDQDMKKPGGRITTLANMEKIDSVSMKK